MRAYCCTALALIAVGMFVPGRLSGRPHQQITLIAPDVEVTVKAADGKPLPADAMAQLLTVTGQLFDQTSVKNGFVRFKQVPKSEYRVLVTAPGYRRGEKRIDLAAGLKYAQLTVELQPIADAEEAVNDRAISALNPRAQKEVGKVLELLRKNKPNDAQSHLEKARKEAPESAEVEYLFGMYATQMKNPAQAQQHWQKTLAMDPKHLSALLEVGRALLADKKAGEATEYLKRAVEVEPSSWRAHALLAEADYLQENREGAFKHAERALDLGHEQAVSLQPLYAELLAESGEKDRAIHALQGYAKAHPSDADAAKQLAELENPQVAAATNHRAMGGQLSSVTAAATAIAVPSNWLPPDVDEKIPATEPGSACALDDVLQKAGEKLLLLVHDFDRFAATESLVDVTVNKWGTASQPEKRKFDYVVSIVEIRPGQLGVDEFRNSGGKPAEFPDGVTTNGLPALVLIFHPFYAGNYEMTCEGLARWNGSPAWQVHFRQRSDKPVANHGFRNGMRGSYPAALRGRAWILAENFQIARLETDLVSPAPEIKLVAEHTAIEYGSVYFREGNVNLWLPQTAEVHFEWQGQRIHRRHSFENYMLFAVDDKQRIGSPKGAAKPASSDAGTTTTPN